MPAPKADAEALRRRMAAVLARDKRLARLPPGSAAARNARDARDRCSRGLHNHAAPAGRPRPSPPLDLLAWLAGWLLQHGPASAPPGARRWVAHLDATVGPVLAAERRARDAYACDGCVGADLQAELQARRRALDACLAAFELRPMPAGPELEPWRSLVQRLSRYIA